MKTNIRRRWIYLPIEVKARELIPKLFLGAKAVEAGFGIFLGRNGMNISRDNFPKGIYFDKCLSRHKIKFHEFQVKTLGNRLVSFDEEGLLFKSEVAYLKKRISQKSIDLSEFIFLWGNEQERIIRTNFSVENKLVVSGGPRLDIWRPEFASLYHSKIEELEQRYGKFVLVVSNWGFSSREREGGLNPHNVHPGNLVSHVRSAFIALITQLSNALPDRTVVVRPHPIDMREYWETIGETFPQNVKVIDDGPISPWIHAAHAVIHNDCTTGLEAWIGKVSTFAYYPIFEEFKEYRRYTMPINELGVICRTAEQLISEISTSFSKDSASGTKKYVTQNDLAREYVHIENSRYASDHIVESLQGLNVAEKNYRISNYGVLKKLRAFWGSLKWRAIDTLGRSGIYTQSYTRQKNPGLEIDEIIDLLTRFAPIIGIDENFFQVRKVDKDTFCIFGKEEVTQQK